MTSKNKQVLEVLIILLGAIILGGMIGFISSIIANV